VIGHFETDIGVIVCIRRIVGCL